MKFSVVSPQPPTPNTRYLAGTLNFEPVLNSDLSSDSVRILPVRGRCDLRQFLTLPWKIYRGNSYWVPPLLSEVKRLLNRRKHPFHLHAEVEYFLAFHNDEVVGRIAATVNRQYVEFHHQQTGFFGFFECIDDPNVATALLNAAEHWLAARSMQRVLGPMSFSTNEECALLVDGFQSAPTVMMPYNPPYYGKLIETAGYEKAKDLLAYLLDDTTPPARLVRGVEHLRQRYNIAVRPVRVQQLQRDVASIQEVYNSAWEQNWCFVPMTKEEVDDLAKQLRLIGDPHLCLLAEHNGEAVGFALALPDYNQVLRYLNGRLFPFGLIKLLWYRRKINMARVLALGLKPGFRNMGIDAMLYLRLWQEAPKNGYPRVECSWILEDNWPMRRGMERMGGRITKTYRIYEKTLSPF